MASSQGLLQVELLDRLLREWGWGAGKGGVKDGHQALWLERLRVGLPLAEGGGGPGLALFWVDHVRPVCRWNSPVRVPGRQRHWRLIQPWQSGISGATAWPPSCPELPGQRAA